jgi:hypothetical protein
LTADARGKLFHLFEDSGTRDALVDPRADRGCHSRELEERGLRLVS